MDVCTRRERGYSEHHTAAPGAEGETESLFNLTVRTLESWTLSPWQQAPFPHLRVRFRAKRAFKVFLYDVHAQRKRGGQPEAVLVLGTSACSMRLTVYFAAPNAHTHTDRLHLCCSSHYAC